MLKILLYVAVFVLAVFLRGIILVDYWHWFVQPLGYPEIRFWHALGLSLMVSWLVLDVSVTRERRDFLTNSITSIIIALVVWGFGASYAYLAG